MGSDTGGSAKIHLCRYLHKCGIEGGERVRLTRKQIMADLSCDDSTSVGTPVPIGAARRDPRRGAIPVMREPHAVFASALDDRRLSVPGEVVSGIQAHM